MGDKPIASGRNAIVMKCKKNDSENGYAVKIKRANPYIYVEIGALAACAGHPNLVKMVDVVKDDRFVFMIMELLAGELLNKYVKRQFPVNECTARKIFTQIVRGMNHVHSEQFVHRNLTVKNIAISRDGNTKILGFGSVTEVETNPQKKTKKLVLSFDKAPPESFEKKIFGQKGDVWNLGVILFTLLTGQHPYCRTPNDTVDEIRKRTMMAQIQFDYNRMPLHSPAAADLIKNLLEPNRNKRIESNQILEHVWCSSGENQIIIEFITEGGKILPLNELSSFQKTELISKFTATTKDDAPKDKITNPIKLLAQQPEQSTIQTAGANIEKKGFVCGVCHKSFNTKRIYNRHSLIHLGLKFVCEEDKCNKVFSQRGKLSAHIKGQHNRQIKASEKEMKKVQENNKDASKRFTCEICNVKFGRLFALKRHTDSVHSECKITYECYMCKKVYTRFERVKKHLKLKHTIKNVCPGASVQKIMPI